MYVKWKESPSAWSIQIWAASGLSPFRRTGGHTGLYGMAYLKSDVLTPGDYGIRSSFDVVPTLFDLLNERLPEKIEQWSPA